MTTDISKRMNFSIKLICSLFLILPLKANANPGQFGLPVPVEPLAQIAAPTSTVKFSPDLLAVVSTANQALLSGDVSKAEDLYLKVFEQAVARNSLPDIILAGGNLQTLYTGSSAVANNELGVFFGKITVNSAISLPLLTVGLYEPIEALNTENVNQVFQELGSNLAVLGRFSESEQLTHIYKKQELRELLQRSDADLLPHGLRLTDREQEIANRYGIEQDLRKSALASFLFPERQIESKSPVAAVQGDKEEVTLYYFVTDQMITILYKSPTGSYVRTKVQSRKDTDRLVTSFRLAISKRLEVKKIGNDLWRALIEPIADLLQEDKPKTLVLNLSGRLRYIPFAALVEPDGKYLVNSYGLVYGSSAVQRNSSQTAKPIKQVAALGLTESRFGQPALPGVRSEIDAIVRSSTSPKGLFPGTAALDGDFTKQKLVAALSGSNDTLHIATHFKFVPNDARRSQLLPGRGDPLSLHELSFLDYSRVRLLTISACETAVGSDLLGQGAEVEGLSATLLYAGAGSVVGTLWRVSDQSTSLLMREFYLLGKDARRTRAEALQMAQINLLKMNGGHFAHPFYWAAFTYSTAAYR